MDNQRKERRDRLIALSFVSVLLVLIYGPGAPWFIGADRFLYDQMASYVSNEPLENGLIVSINGSRMAPKEVSDQYGRLIQRFKKQNVKRIVLASPPALDKSGELPGWAATLSSGVPVYVPINHRLADVASKSGFLDVTVDNDGVFRRSELWKFHGGLMSPSLPLAMALDNPEAGADPRVSGAENAIYLSNYEPIPRLTAKEVLEDGFKGSGFVDTTVFIDAAPSIVAAAAVLPSGQFVTLSEITAALLANVEQRRSVIAPAWVRAMEVLAPALLAIVAVLFLPGRMRRDIIMISAIIIAGLILVEALLLVILRVRLDLGRPIFIFLGAPPFRVCKWRLSSSI